MKDGFAKKVPEETLAHTVPCRQKQAREYLQGRAPGESQANGREGKRVGGVGFWESGGTGKRWAK